MPDGDLEQRIRERAFFIWIGQGRPEGRDREHWQQAESELTAAPDETPQLASEAAPSIQAEPSAEAIGQIRYAVARDVDQGGSASGQQQSQSAAPSWDAYRR
jgi:hypothetical protein